MRTIPPGDGPLLDRFDYLRWVHSHVEAALQDESCEVQIDQTLGAVEVDGDGIVTHPDGLSITIRTGAASSNPPLPTRKSFDQSDLIR